jgi:hypothetical protein
MSNNNAPTWAFAAPAGQPLPPAYQFNPLSGFTDLVTHIQNTADAIGKENNHDPRLNRHVATYRDRAHKDSFVGIATNTPQQVTDYKKGATISGAVKEYVSGGSIGVVVSPMSNAAQLSQQQNDWHCVAMGRQADKVWVYDPAYDATAHVGNLKTVNAVPGNANVHRLVHEWKTVKQVYYQGPPNQQLVATGQQQLECMGRSAQWVGATLDGTLPWPPDSNASGGQWVVHSKD